jgi:hypothetical protein
MKYTFYTMDGLTKLYFGSLFVGASATPQDYYANVSWNLEPMVFFDDMEVAQAFVAVVQKISPRVCEIEIIGEAVNEEGD